MQDDCTALADHVAIVDHKRHLALRVRIGRVGETRTVHTRNGDGLDRHLVLHSQFLDKLGDGGRSRNRRVVEGDHGMSPCLC